MKKSFSIISVLLIAALLAGSFATVAGALDEPYTLRDVTAYVYSPDSTKTIKLAFYDELPEIPYIDPCDYLEIIYNAEFEQSDAGDGMYTVSTENGMMLIDPEDDIIGFSDFETFLSTELNSDNSAISVDFLADNGQTLIGSKKALVIDLSEYDIDITEIDGKVYLPLSVLGHIFASTYNNGEYIDGALYFSHVLDDAARDGFADKSSLYNTTVRSEALARFVYNDLCFSMDYFYGCPTSAPGAVSIAEKGFDRTLEEYSDDTRLIKELLLSTDKIDYMFGLTCLQSLLNDGGHTVFFADPLSESFYYMDSPLTAGFVDRLSDKEDRAVSLAREGVLASNEKQNIRTEVSAQREEVLENYAMVEEWENIAALYSDGITALFIFDSFDTDVVDSFKTSIDWAVDNGVRNFAIDLTTNGGGLVAALDYMIAIMTKTNVMSLRELNTSTGNIVEESVLVDVNRDGQFDDADAETVYDLNFAVLTSGYSFSCGNLLPMLARENGIAVIGKQSGGGSCTVIRQYLADSHFYFASSTSKFAVESGADVDLGAVVNFDPTVTDGEGVIDYRPMYDFDTLGTLIEAFYECGEHTPVTVKTNETEATLEHDGGYEETVYCEECGAVLDHTEKHIHKTVLDAYRYTEDNVFDMIALFLDDLPDVPFVNPLDYVRVIFTDPFEIESEDGVYTITNAYGATMVIDAVNDTITFEDYDSFTDCYVDQEGSSVEMNFVEFKEGYSVADPSAVTIDLGSYGVDILESEGMPYIPLAYLGAMFSITYNNSFYLDGEILFHHTFDPESYTNYVDESSIYANTSRSKAMAEFTYNSLCYMFDYFFGKPSSSLLAEQIKEVGFDRALETFDENTVLAKQLLLSEDMVEYLIGYTVLSPYMYDGGHTVMLNIPVYAVNYYSDMPLGSAFLQALYGSDELSDIFWDFYDIQVAMFDESAAVFDYRDEAYEKYGDEIVKTWDTGELLIIHEDTAFFSFDGFEEYTPYVVKEALDIANEAGVSVFIVDDTCNGGGYVATQYYITSLISNAKYHQNEATSISCDPLTGAMSEYVYLLDLNLDGVIDEKDKSFDYDFDIAVLTSGYSFSSANALPIAAQLRGIMILGETSGGGSCNVTSRYLPDGLNFPISDINMEVKPDGGDYDDGAPVDVELVEIDGETGEKDYSKLFDLDNLHDLVVAFYDEKWTPGDINGDGEVNNKDVVALFRYCSDLDAVTVLRALDVNGDKSVNNKDIIRLFNYLNNEGVVISEEPYRIAA